jgi:hypothetical protein
MDRVLNVVSGIALEGSDDADSIRKSWWVFLVLVIEPSALFELRCETFESGSLFPLADDCDPPRLDVEFPTLDPVIDVSVNDDFEAILEVDVHIPIAAPPEHTRKLVCTVGEREVEGCVAPTEIRDLTITADILERFGRVYDI